MKTIKELLYDLETVGVFNYANSEYICTGYDFDVTMIFVNAHKELKEINKIKSFNIKGIKYDIKK